VRRSPAGAGGRGSSPSWGRLVTCLEERQVTNLPHEISTGSRIMGRLKGKVAIVTGGGSGIGRATCELFAEEGAAVVVAEREPAGGQETERLIRDPGGKALFVPTDVADEESVRRLVAESVRVFGAVNVPVNN